MGLSYGLVNLMYSMLCSECWRIKGSRSNKRRNLWLVLQTVYLKYTPIFPAERLDLRYITPKGKGKAKGSRTSASTVIGKNTVFGVLVNKVQVEQSEAIRQLTPGPRNACTSSSDVERSTTNDDDTEFVGKHQGLPVKEANSKLKISL